MYTLRDAINQLKPYLSSGDNEAGRKRIEDALGMELNDAVKQRISPQEKYPYNLREVLEKMKREDVEVCKNELETVLKRDVVSLVFGDNTEELKGQDFYSDDIEHYFIYYLAETDYGLKLNDKHIHLGSEGKNFDKKIFLLLSLYRFCDDNGFDVNVKIPFERQGGRKSELYNLGLDKLSIEYGGKDKVDRVLNLVIFCRELEKFLKDVDPLKRKGTFGNKWK